MIHEDSGPLVTVRSSGHRSFSSPPPPPLRVSPCRFGGSSVLSGVPGGHERMRAAFEQATPGEGRGGAERMPTDRGFGRGWKRVEPAIWRERGRFGGCWRLRDMMGPD